jgi:chloramphenicol-sensitive protein RarD
VRRGLWYGAAAYTIWGLFPLYWKLIEFVPAQQIISHRIVWSFIVLLPLVLLSLRRTRRAGGAGSVGVLVTTAGVGIYAAAAVLIAINWFTYVWAVNHDLVVETSLGYFITPLVNVLLGIIVLRESLRARQWLAVAVAAAGVGYLSFAYGAVPWIALALAASFGTYGLVKKKAPMAPLGGLTLETGLLFAPAAIYLVIANARGDGAFGHAGTHATLLLAGSGIVTTVPLLMFASAAHRVPLSVIGILQFISPTIQFLLGVFVYREPFTRAQLVGFAMVWAALVIFAADGFLAHAQPRAVLDEGEF